MAFPEEVQRLMRPFEVRINLIVLFTVVLFATLFLTVHNGRFQEGGVAFNTLYDYGWHLAVPVLALTLAGVGQWGHRMRLRQARGQEVEGQKVEGLMQARQYLFIWLGLASVLVTLAYGATGSGLHAFLYFVFLIAMSVQIPNEDRIRRALGLKRQKPQWPSQKGN